MKDVRVERLARLICRYSIGVKKGDAIVIAPVRMLPFAVRTARPTVRSGAAPRISTSSAVEFSTQVSEFGGAVTPVSTRYG